MCVLGLINIFGLPRTEGGALGGLCLPSECSASNLRSEGLKKFLDETLSSESKIPLSELGKQYLVNVRDTIRLGAATQADFTCGSHAFSVDTTAAVVIIITALLLVVVTITTVMEYWMPNMFQGLGRFGTAFSARRNLNRLFNTRRRNKEFRCLDGLRAMSMGWVILGHELAFEASIGYINPFAILPPTGALKGWLAQILFSSRYAVDTFFFISGFLVFHSVMQRLTKGTEITARWVLGYAAHRWIRLTPTYMFCILLWWKIAPLLGSGPMWFHWRGYAELCDNFWWTNILYINNLVPFGYGENGTCFFHGWYLANDMQFYLLTPLFIVAYRRSVKWTVALCTFIITVSTTSAFLVAKSEHWSAADLDGAAVGAYDREGYIMPYFRIPAYLIGTLLAITWLSIHPPGSQRTHAIGQADPNAVVPGMRKTAVVGGAKVDLDPFMASMLETIALLLLLLCVFGGVDADQARPCSYMMWPQGPVLCGSGPEWDTTERATYASLTKPAWCVGLGLLCWVAFQDKAGIVGWFLNHDAWVVPARLSFGMYLLHPIIINVWFQKQTQFFRWSAVDFMLRFFGVFMGTFVAAVAVNLAIESPFSLLTRGLLMPSHSGSRKNGKGRRVTDDRKSNDGDNGYDDDDDDAEEDEMNRQHQTTMLYGNDTSYLPEEGVVCVSLGTTCVFDGQCGSCDLCELRSSLVFQNRKWGCDGNKQLVLL